MAKAILNYGLYGIEPEVTPENESICMSLAQISNDIDRAQLRREKNIADGQTGGRPTVSVANQDLIDFLESGRTQEEAAKKWGVSLRTI